MTAEPLQCREVVELVTDYLDGTLPPHTHAAVAQHLRDCEGCAVYIDQIRQTARVLGSMPPPPLDSDWCDRLTAAFRHWSDEQRSP